MKKLLIIIAAIALVGIGGVALALSNDSAKSPSGPASSTETYTREQVATHGSRSDCWTHIRGAVYDLTTYVSQHPGGDEILRACGADGTSLFEERMTSDGQKVGSGTGHSSSARSQLEQLKIGTLSN